MSLAVELQRWVAPLGWALVHFCWQGGAVALVAWAGMTLARGPRLRYAIGCLGLVAMLALPIATLAWIGPDARPAAVVPDEVPRLAGEPARRVEPPERRAGSPAKREAPTLSARLTAATPALVTLWLVGVAALATRHIVGLAQLSRLRRRAAPIADAVWLERVRTLSARLQVRRRVALLATTALDCPAVVGAIRPAILWPAAALTGLTPSQVEALLAHELAHVRRHDYLVNLLQTLVETLCFYHPAAWWLGRRVRQEREHCCDDLAAGVVGDRTVYAGALVAMESLRATPSLALGAGGGSLMTRVRRLLSPAPASGVGWLAMLLLQLATIAIVAALLWRPAASGPVALTSPDRPLQVGDRLSVSVFDGSAGGARRTLLRNVDANGEIELPTVGPLVVGTDQPRPTAGRLLRVVGLTPEGVVRAINATEWPGHRTETGAEVVVVGHDDAATRPSPAETKELTDGEIAARDPFFAQLLKLRSDLAAQLEEVGTKQGENAPNVVRLRQSLESTDQRLAKIAETIRRAAATQPTFGDRLAAGDLLRITISDLAATGTDGIVVKRIAGDGTITLPYFKSPLDVRGLTTAEAERKISDGYRKVQVLTDANVGVLVVQTSDGRTVVPPGLFAPMPPGSADAATPAQPPARAFNDADLATLAASDGQLKWLLDQRAETQREIARLRHDKGYADTSTRMAEDTLAKLEPQIAERARALAEGRPAIVAAAAPSPATLPADGKIAAGQLLRLSVMDLTGPGQETVVIKRVGPDGRITMPYLPDGVAVAGAETAAAEAVVAKAYVEKQILSRAVVSVLIVQDANGREVVPAALLGGPAAARAEAPAASPPQPAAPVGDGSIHVGDLVQVKVADLAGAGLETVLLKRVEPNGNISMPYIGAVAVAGKQPADAEALMVKRYADAQILTHAMLSVLVVQDASGRELVPAALLGNAAADANAPAERQRQQAEREAEQSATRRQIAELKAELDAAQKQQRAAAAQAAAKPAPASPGEYYLGGKVQRPGVYAISPTQPTSLKQAMIAAGLLDPALVDDRAAEYRAKVPVWIEVVRRDPAPGEGPTVREFAALFAGTAADPVLKPGDQVMVGVAAPRDAAAAPGTAPASQPATQPAAIGEYYMGGHVQRPGVYSLTGRTITLKQAIASAGGFDGAGGSTRVDVIHRLAEGGEEITTRHLDALLAGKEADVTLRPNDTVMVGVNEAPTTASAPAAPAAPPASGPAAEGGFKIMGRVQKPGIYALTGDPLTLRQAIAWAGMLDPKLRDDRGGAYRSREPVQVQVVRRDPNGMGRTIARDFNDLMANVAPDVSIRRDDEIVVLPAAQMSPFATTRPATSRPTAGEYYVGGKVQRTGAYSLTARKITLKQAIISAGMLDPALVDGGAADYRAKVPVSIQIVRRDDGDGAERTISREFGALMSGKEEDVYLEINDQVLVGAPPPSAATRPAGDAPATRPTTGPTSGLDDAAIRRLAARDPFLERLVQLRDDLAQQLDEARQTQGPRSPRVERSEQLLNTVDARVRATAEQLAKIPGAQPTVGE